jgi:transcription termination factor Rho
MAEQQLERSMLDGKDREQLHAIAGAMGIKGVTRLRKADLVDAILEAASGNGAAATAGATNGTTNGARKSTKATKATKTAKTTATDDGDAEAPAPARRAVRSKRASELESEGDLAALAAEEDALSGGDEPQVSPRPMRRTSSTSSSAPATDAAATDAAAAATSDTATASATATSESGGGTEARDGGGTRRTESRESRDSGGGNQPRVDPEDERASFGEGNRTGRRRRRRGRDRNAGGGGGGGNQNNERDRIPDGEPKERDYAGDPIDIQGLLDLRDEGYGFLRTTGYLAGRNDVYVSASQVRRFALRKGDFVKGQTRPPASNEKYPALLRVDEINAMSPDAARDRVRFEDLTPLFPDEQLRLELLEDPSLLTGRIVDLLSPIGKGQRGLIVSPPKVGKTTIMKQIVGAIERNNPEVHLMVLLVDERPEEVTDMKRHVQRGEVIASTFDRPSDEHTHVSELAIERAKRLVELGKDVTILLDGITRLARAYNLAAPASGRIMSGGIDAGALYPPKRFFGAARNVEEGGSLTIIATALVDTNSKMDEHIFEEFKGTGNWELKLDRKLAERRLFPAIDVNSSSTRHEELLFTRDQLAQVWKLRRVLNALAQEGSSAPGLELLLDKLRTTKSNDEFLAEIAKAPTPGG